MRVRLEVSIASRSLMINGSASGLLQVLTELVDNATYALENDAVEGWCHRPEPL